MSIAAGISKGMDGGPSSDDRKQARTLGDYPIYQQQLSAAGCEQLFDRLTTNLSPRIGAGRWRVAALANVWG